MKDPFKFTVGKRLTHFATLALIFSLAGCALIGIAIVLLGSFNETEVKVLVTAGSVAGLSILALPSFFHIERANHQNLARLGIATSLALFGLLMYVIWGGEIRNGEMFGKTLASIGIIAFSTNHALLILIAKQVNKRITICQRATVLIISVVSVLLLLGIWTEKMPEIVIRLLAALVILDALGTMSVPILAKTSKSP